jgi:type I restriction enzyme R subunit
VANLKGDDARAGFVEVFKKVQKLQTQLDQYTDLTPEQTEVIQTILPKDELNAFRGQYLETAQRLRAQQAKPRGGKTEQVDQIDFEFVLFASATIDYDYIMKLIADFSTKKPGTATMSREQLIGLIAGDSKFIDERDDITEYVMSLKAGEGLNEAAIRAGYQRFKAVMAAREVAELSARHGLPAAALQGFVDSVLERRIFDGERLTELLVPLELGWKARTQKELALMIDLVPMLKKRAGGRDISGLKAYED